MKSTLLLTLALITLLGVTSLTAASQPTPATNPSPTSLSPYPWFYLRDGRPISPDEPVVELIAVGDVMLGRDGPNQSLENDPFANARPWLLPADILFANLESVIVAKGTPRTAPDGHPQPIILRARPPAVSILREAGFDILSLANNHALDYGPDGLGETVNRLNAARIKTIGAGPTPSAAAQPLIYEINGLRLAFLSFNAIPDPTRADRHNLIAPIPQVPSPISLGRVPTTWTPATWDRETATNAIAGARAQADAVIVSLHWGYEYEPRPDPSQETAAQTLLAAGADLIIGHHPHVAQSVHVQDDRLVAYSLGNFRFDQQSYSDQGQGDTAHGLALRAFFDRDGLRAVQALPIQAGLQPRLLSPQEAAPFLAQISPPPPRQAFACDRQTCRPVPAPKARLRAESQSGLFWAGEIDLTGDGQPETVRRTGGRVTVYDQGTAVWNSPAEWRVIDLALGDPNDDGRAELLLAIRKKDPDGYERSQPYIVGYRGGTYKLLWGGRPVNDPIYEVELGDLDGDGAQELVVLEDRHDGTGQTISVWRFAGWSFTHIWRSPPGRYHDLSLTTTPNPIITVASSPNHHS